MKTPKKLAVFSAVLLGSVLLAEGAARVWAGVHGSGYSGADADRELSEIVSSMTDLLPESGPGDAEPAAPGGVARYRLHPYTGYNTQAGISIADGCAEQLADPTREPTFDVFLFGGSVAAIFAGGKQGALDLLGAALERQPEVGGRPVRFWNFAVPGFKQPQQLTELAYVFARGAVPDLVLNLDGLNEVRMAAVNAQAGLALTWPAAGHWAKVASGLDDPEAEALQLTGMALQGRVLDLVRSAERWHLTRSCLLGRPVLARARALRAEWNAAQAAFVARSMNADGARPAGTTGAELMEAVRSNVECWYQSSLSMHHLCAARGVRYLHLVQPNLHDIGSKPVSAEEESKAIGAEGRNLTVVQGYPLLRERAAELRRQGVECFDFTRVFAETDETLFYDPAHFNRRGNEILAEALIAAW